MKPINLNLSNLGVGRLKIKGQIYDTQDPVYLVQDILDIELPNGNSIDVGWHPESDLDGSFRIVVYRDHWSNQLTKPIRTKDVLEVVEDVRQLVREYSKPTVTVSCSNETRKERIYKQSSMIFAIGAASA